MSRGCVHGIVNPRFERSDVRREPEWRHVTQQRTREAVPSWEDGECVCVYVCMREDPLL